MSKSENASEASMEPIVRPCVELTDWIRQSKEEPIAWFCFYAPGSPFESKVFDNKRDAEDFAHDQIEASGEATHWIFPLYAGDPEEYE